MGLKVYTGGTFDLFHAGHVKFLEQCARFGNVYVSLNTDEFIKKYKGTAPVMTFDERKNVLLSCKWVHDVLPNYHGADSKTSIICVDPDMIIIGSDWARRDYYSQMGFDQDWLDSRGITLAYIPYTEGISTTDIKARLSKR